MPLSTKPTLGSGYLQILHFSWKLIKKKNQNPNQKANKHNQTKNNAQ